MKITKKAINEAPEFILVIDWKSEKRKDMADPFTYKILTACTIPEAMDEAEKEIDETVYLVKLLQKTGDLDHDEYDPNLSMGIIYSAVLCNRKNGWHTNNYNHSEGRFEVTYNPNWSFDPITYYRGE